jgi:NADH:ubiquinone oxidoreductase subunit 6 (subunit J)
MHIVAVAWLFVVGLMTLAEATSSQGTLLGALITLLLYGLLPLAIVLYIMGTPARKRARRAAEAAQSAPSAAPDGGRVAAGDAVAPKREEG